MLTTGNLGLEFSVTLPDILAQHTGKYKKIIGARNRSDFKFNRGHIFFRCIFSRSSPRNAATILLSTVNLDLDFFVTLPGNVNQRTGKMRKSCEVRNHMNLDFSIIASDLWLFLNSCSQARATVLITVDVTFITPKLVSRHPNVRVPQHVEAP